MISAAGAGGGRVPVCASACAAHGSARVGGVALGGGAGQAPSAEWSVWADGTGGSRAVQCCTAAPPAHPLVGRLCAWSCSTATSQSWPARPRFACAHACRGQGQQRGGGRAHAGARARASAAAAARGLHGAAHARRVRPPGPILPARTQHSTAQHPPVVGVVLDGDALALRVQQQQVVDGWTCAVEQRGGGHWRAAPCVRTGEGTAARARAMNTLTPCCKREARHSLPRVALRHTIDGVVRGADAAVRSAVRQRSPRLPSVRRPHPYASLLPRAPVPLPSLHCAVALHAGEAATPAMWPPPLPCTRLTVWRPARAPASSTSCCPSPTQWCTTTGCTRETTRSARCACVCGPCAPPGRAPDARRPPRAAPRAPARRPQVVAQRAPA